MAGPSGVPDEVAMAAEPNSGGDRKPPSDGSENPSGWVGFASIGFEFVAAILVPGAVGWWLDGRFGTRPWIMLGCGLLGFIAGLRLLMRSVTGTRK
jgi:F0F1-type ATP synthase assembly protein I